MSRASRSRYRSHHRSSKHPRSANRSHNPRARPDPASSAALIDWEHVCRIAGAQAFRFLASEDAFYAECAAVIGTLTHVLPAAELRNVISTARHEKMMIRGYIPHLVDAGLLTMLLAIESIADGKVHRAAATAVDQMIEAGAVIPDWAKLLREPTAIGSCLCVLTPEGTVCELMATFVRADDSHTMRIAVDEHHCGAAIDIAFATEAHMAYLLDARRKVDTRIGTPTTTKTITPTEFRRLAEAALATRAAHDRNRSLLALHDLAFDDDSDDAEPGYLALSIVLRSRLRDLPTSTAPPPPHRPSPHCPVTPDG